jgi:hypothetical protein
MVATSPTVCHFRKITTSSRLADNGRSAPSSVGKGSGGCQGSDMWTVTVASQGLGSWIGSGDGTGGGSRASLCAGEPAERRGSAEVLGEPAFGGKPARPDGWSRNTLPTFATGSRSGLDRLPPLSARPSAGRRAYGTPCLAGPGALPMSVQLCPPSRRARISSSTACWEPVAAAPTCVGGRSVHPEIDRAGARLP